MFMIDTGPYHRACRKLVVSNTDTALRRFLKSAYGLTNYRVLKVKEFIQ